MSTTETALFARLQRRLRAEGLQLRRCPKRSRWFGTLGRFYVTDPARNWIEAMHVDPAAWLADRREVAQ